MNEFELSCINDDEIVKEIVKIILNRYPIVENRLDILFYYPRPSIDIMLNFYEVKSRQFTQVLFCDGTDNIRSAIPDKVIINDFISIKTLCNLIHYILNDHDYIKSISKQDKLIELSFDVNMKEDNIQGISCGNINLKLDFDHMTQYKELSDYYLKVIVENFYDQLKFTESFKKEFNDYCLLVKQKTINSLSGIELYDFIKLLNNEDLCNLLLSMPNERFFELYANFQKQKIKKKIN